MSKAFGIAVSRRDHRSSRCRRRPPRVSFRHPRGERAPELPGKFAPKRPELANVKASGMTCWAAKLLLDEAMEQRVGSKKTIKLLGFTCRYKPETEASGVVSCTGHGGSRARLFSVF